MIGIGLALPTIAIMQALGAGGAPPPLSAVAADGWQATVATPTDLSLAPVMLARQGFDATGAATSYAESVRLGKRVRQPYPNQATLTANAVALTDYVYSTDTIVGVANNSTEISPKPVANWSLVGRKVVGNALTLELVAFHRNGRAGKPVACVEFRASDGTTTVTAKVSTLVVSPEAGDRAAVLVYRATLDITALADGALITANAKVLPWIGGAASVLDSAASAVAREFSPQTYVKNIARAAAPLAPPARAARV